jgi:hypothetical protein
MGPPTLYAVRRVLHGEEWGPYTDGRVEKVFADRAAAEHFCQERERWSWRRRLDVNPFYESYAGHDRSLQELTGMDEPVFGDYLRDMGLEPPAPSKNRNRWFDWWNETAGALLEHEREQLWRALDRFHFYEVVEVPFEG